MERVETPPDGQLIERARAKDHQAFGELVERHKDRMVNYLTRLTGCRDRAEELAQETFVRFYQTLQRYREGGNLTAYLMRIATNLVRSEERRKRRWALLKPIFSHSETFVGVTVGGYHPAPSPQICLLAREEQQQVVDALASLDLLYRAPLVLREIEGLSYDDIADALDTNVGTIKSRLHRGRQLLKDKLTPYWNGGEDA